MKQTDTNKVKMLIQDRLRWMKFPELFDDELKEALRLVKYLELCLWVEKE